MAVSRPGIWRACKILLALIILACVAWQFARVFVAAETWQGGVRVDLGWALAAGLLYLLGLGCSAFFWYRLLRVMGQHLTPWVTLQAFYVGQLGRYMPGKVVGVLVRARLLSGPGVNNRMAVFTIVYEALTTLLAGALLATALLPLGHSASNGLQWQALALLIVIGIPLIPAIFNRLVRKLAPSVPANDDSPPPALSGLTLLEGLVLTTCGWALQGASLWATLEAICPQAPALDWQNWASYSAFVALATVIGFLVVFVPGGLGVRELLLQGLLTAELSSALGGEGAAYTAAVAVLLLRMIWIVAEVTAAGVFYWLPGPNMETKLSTIQARWKGG